MKYICSICGYVYDEDKQKVPFSNLPDNWKCPLCGAPKSAFAAEKGPQPAREQSSKIAPILDEDMKKLSAGQLAALFSNLARGCEKQYKFEEAALFTEIADFYTAGVPSEENTSIDELSSLLKNDIDEMYPLTMETAENAKDRGAQRIRVWGEKVTRMLSSLVDQYRAQGEEMLKNTEVWVCTVCGFIYIGENAPDLCPVCKVPAWKFEKIEGRRSA